MRKSSVKRVDPGIKIEAPDPELLGPAMSALTEKQRKWVVAYAMCGDATVAAREAGYSDEGNGCKVIGFNLARNPKVIDALSEWSRGALNGRGAFVAVQALIEIAQDPEHTDRFKAADSLADRVGFARQTSHQVTVEHIDQRSDDELLRIVNQAFARPALPVIDTTAEEVVDDTKA